MTTWNPTTHTDGTLKSSATQNTNEDDLLDIINGNIDAANVQSVDQISIGKQTITQIFKSTISKLGLHHPQPGYIYNSDVSRFAQEGAMRKQESLQSASWTVLPGMDKLVNVDYNARLIINASCSFTAILQDYLATPYRFLAHETNFRTVPWQNGTYITILMPNLYFEVALFTDQGGEVQVPGSLARFTAAGCASQDSYTIEGTAAKAYNSIFNDGDAAYSAGTRTYEAPAIRSGSKGSYHFTGQFDATENDNSKVKVYAKIRPVFDVTDYNWDDGVNAYNPIYTSSALYLETVKKSILGYIAHSSCLSVLTIKQRPTILP